MKIDSKKKGKRVKEAPKFRYNIQSQRIPWPVQFEYPQCLKGKHNPTLSSSSQAVYKELERARPRIDNFLKESIEQDRLYLLQKLKQKRQEGNHGETKEAAGGQKNEEVDTLQYKLNRSDVDEYIKNDQMSKIYDYPTQSIRIDHQKFMKECSLNFRDIKDFMRFHTRCNLSYSIYHAKLQQQCKDLGTNATQSLQSIKTFYGKRAARLDDFFPGGYDFALKNLIKCKSESEGQSQHENKRNN